MKPREPEQLRVPFDVAARLPPAWDTPEHKQQIYSTFERLQLCLACGNARQAAHLLHTLQRLTEEAEHRRRAQLGAVDAVRRLAGGCVA